MRMFHRDIDGDSNGTLEKDEIVQQLQKLALPPQKALTASDTRTCPRTSACTYALMHLDMYAPAPLHTDDTRAHTRTRSHSRLCTQRTTLQGC